MIIIIILVQHRMVKIWHLYCLLIQKAEKINKVFEKHNILSKRTLHCVGVNKKDYDGEILKDHLNKFLNQCNGKIDAMVMIPDYNNIFNLEKNRYKIKLLHKLNIQRINKNHLTKFILPSHIK